MQRPRIAAVVPTCRGFKVPEQTVPVKWYVVHDRERRNVDENGQEVHHIVAPEPEMYGQRCDSIRSAGFLQAYLDGYDYVLTVDDDCFVPKWWAAQHSDGLSVPVPHWNFTVEGVYTRGMPRSGLLMPVALTHGLWNGVLDYSAFDMHHAIVPYYHKSNAWRRIHPPFAQSAMNIGFKRDVTQVMYQPAQGEGTPFDRYADIWGGMFAQKALSEHDWAFVNGGAQVYHERASSVEANKDKEAPGDRIHRELWQFVWSMDVRASSLVQSYCKIAARLRDFPVDSDYFAKIGENMFRWVDLCEGRK